MIKAFFISLLLTCGISIVNAQARLSETINTGWEFHKGDINPLQTPVKWTNISIPHTWNSADVLDDDSGYYRGIGWYKKTLFIPPNWKDKDVYIYFEGVGQVAEVFVNGKLVGKHIGSYNSFNFKLNKYLLLDSSSNKANQILIKADNTFNENIPPLSADFTFYGGIYRDIYLKVINKVHFDVDNYASSGIFISAPSVSEAMASVRLKGAITNTDNYIKNINVTHRIIDSSGVTINVLKESFKLKPNQTISFNHDLKEIPNPRLWSPEQPYLYRLVSSISDVKNKLILDEVSNSFGFRWFSFDSDKGFYLNGKPVKLIGASRHQDYSDIGNALTDAMHVRDIELLKQMGANFLRIAHYPQDPTILEACDRLGILTSVETPIVNYITESEPFSENSRNMHREMIRQNFNHPSLIIWAYMNEILLKPKYEKNSKEQESYFNAVTKLARDLEAISNAEDPDRYTLIPNHQNFDLYRKVHLTDIPRLVGWNLYQGWYGGNFSGLDTFIENHRKQLPTKPLLITEYGADADERIHSFNPVRFDKSIEYATSFHEYYLKTINSKPYVAAGMIWNLADFNAEERAETMPHMNTKGLLSSERQPKDLYSFYQANLLKVPYVKIGSKEWKLRSGFSTSENDVVCRQPVQVFSNQKQVSLVVNNEFIGSSETINGIASFIAPFKNGFNEVVASVEVKGKSIIDQTIIDFELLTQNLKNPLTPFKKISVSLGDNRFFYDKQNSEIWIPEKPYQTGSWGYVGGNIFKMAAGRQSYGSDKNIKGTELDPVYQTQRVGIEGFNFDVADGEYELTLHFAELLSNAPKEDLVYNLAAEKVKDRFEDRVFNVSINGILFLSNLNNAEEIQPEKPLAIKMRVTVNENKRIFISFEPIVGKTILNGIQLRKIY